MEDLGLSNTTDTPNGVIPILSDVLNFRGRHQTAETEWRSLEQYVFYFRPASDLPSEPSLDSSQKAAHMLCQQLGLCRLNTVDVLHRTKAFGLVVTHQDGWRLV